MRSVKLEARRRAGWVVAWAVCAFACATAVVAASPEREVLRSLTAPKAVPAELDDVFDPEGRTRWDWTSLSASRTVETRIVAGDDGESWIVVHTEGDASREEAYSDLDAPRDAEAWLFPDRASGTARPGNRRWLDVERRFDDRAERLRIEVVTVGNGWLHLPSGPREIVLQRALVLSAENGSRRFSPSAVVHRFVDPRAGVVAHVSGPATPDGRSRLRVDEIGFVDEVLAGVADLVLYIDEFEKPIDGDIRYGIDVGEGTPVSSLVPDPVSTIGDLVALDTWDFSGNTTGARISAAFKTEVDAQETCNSTQCGYTVPNGELGQNIKGIDSAEPRVDNQVQEREDRAGDVTIWLRAGAQNEGVDGIFGSGESRYCFVSEGGETRSEVPLFRFANQDANGFFVQPGDSWSGGPFQCEQTLFNETCGGGGLFSDLWAQACNDKTGTQGAEALKTGVVVLPSGHTLNAMLIRQNASYCVYTGSSCSAFLKTEEVNAYVHLFNVPNLGTLVQLRSALDVPDPDSYTVLDATEIVFSLLPPLSIASTAADDTSVTLSWNPGNDTSRIDRYKVYWDVDSGSADDYAFNSDTHPGQVVFNGTEATVSGLDPGTTYYFTVTSLSSFTSVTSGVQREYESIRYPTTASGDPDFVYPVEVVEQTTGGGCTPTEEVANLVVDKTVDGIEICWDPVSDACAVGYRVLGADSPESDANFTSLAETGLETCWSGNPAETYFLVVARGTDGDGPWGHYGR